MTAKRRLRLLTVVGARPQFIKAAALSRAIAAHNQASATIAIDEEILHTGQHYDPMMSQVFFDELEIPSPVVNLHIGSRNSHGEATAAMLVGIERELLARKPDCALVHGDTNSTLAGALAAAKLRIRVAHMEAGMRSGDRRMPEEINRVLVDHIASLLFCSSERARENLAARGPRGRRPRGRRRDVRFRGALSPEGDAAEGVRSVRFVHPSPRREHRRPATPAQHPPRPGGIAASRALAASSAHAEDDASARGLPPAGGSRCWSPPPISPCSATWSGAASW